MKKNTNVVIAVVVGVVLLILAVFLIRRPKHVAPPQQVAGPYPTHKRGGPCPGETQTFVNGDGWMKGIVDSGAKFDVIMNYYDCNKPQVGDVVLYSLSPQLAPVIKRVVAAGGDHFQVVPDENHTWDLKVNGKYVMMVTDPSRKYFFGSTHPATLSLYEKDGEGVLRPDELILFSTWSPGDKDSGLFGVANVSDVLGKVIPKGGGEASETSARPEAPSGPEASKQTAPASGKSDAKSKSKGHHRKTKV